MRIGKLDNVLYGGPSCEVLVQRALALRRWLHFLQGSQGSFDVAEPAQDGGYWDLASLTIKRKVLAFRPPKSPNCHQPLKILWYHSLYG